jgi:hypothetical protein
VYANLFVVTQRQPFTLKPSTTYLLLLEKRKMLIAFPYGEACMLISAYKDDRSVRQLMLFSLRNALICML